MVIVSHADRIIFPDIRVDKGTVVAYYERIAARALPHISGRPLSIRRFPKGLSGAGFFQKNVPPHYPEAIARLAVPRSREATRRHPERSKSKPSDPSADVTIYPVLSEPEQLAYLANQGAIELHVPLVLAADLTHPDRVVIDLDPPEGALALVQQAALLVRDALCEFGLNTIPLATGSKGYHLVSAIEPTIEAETLARTLQKTGALLAARHPQQLTTTFRIAQRGGRVFVDWLRNRTGATVIAPYSLRAKPRANVATPLEWQELESTAPDAFTIFDIDRLLDRGDPLARMTARPLDVAPFVAKIDAEFAASGLELEVFDRFRS